MIISHTLTSHSSINRLTIKSSFFMMLDIGKMRRFLGVFFVGLVCIGFLFGVVVVSSTSTNPSIQRLPIPDVHCTLHPSHLLLGLSSNDQRILAQLAAHIADTDHAAPPTTNSSSANNKSVNLLVAYSSPVWPGQLRIPTHPYKCEPSPSLYRHDQEKEKENGKKKEKNDEDDDDDRHHHLQPLKALLASRGCPATLPSSTTTTSSLCDPLVQHISIIQPLRVALLMLRFPTTPHSWCNTFQRIYSLLLLLWQDPTVTALQPDTRLPATTTHQITQKQKEGENNGDKNRNNDHDHDDDDKNVAFLHSVMAFLFKSTQKHAQPSSHNTHDSAKRKRIIIHDQQPRPWTIKQPSLRRNHDQTNRQHNHRKTTRTSRRRTGTTTSVTHGTTAFSTRPFPVRVGILHAADHDKRSNISQLTDTEHFQKYFDAHLRLMNQDHDADTPFTKLVEFVEFHVPMVSSLCRVLDKVLEQGITVSHNQWTITEHSPVLLHALHQLEPAHVVGMSEPTVTPPREISEKQVFLSRALVKPLEISTTTTTTTRPVMWKQPNPILRKHCSGNCQDNRRPKHTLVFPLVLPHKAARSNGTNPTSRELSGIQHDTNDPTDAVVHFATSSPLAGGPNENLPLAESLAYTCALAAEGSNQKTRTTNDELKGALPTSLQPFSRRRLNHDNNHSRRDITSTLEINSLSKKLPSLESLQQERVGDSTTHFAIVVVILLCGVTMTGSVAVFLEHRTRLYNQSVRTSNTNYTASMPRKGIIVVREQVTHKSKTDYDNNDDSITPNDHCLYTTTTASKLKPPSTIFLPNDKDDAFGSLAPYSSLHAEEKRSFYSENFYEDIELNSCKSAVGSR